MAGDELNGAGRYIQNVLSFTHTPEDHLRKIIPVA